MVEDHGGCEDELWMRVKQLNLFVLTHAEHWQAHLPLGIPEHRIWVLDGDAGMVFHNP